MRDLLIEDGVDMTHETETSDADAAHQLRQSMASLNVCPFCGAVREQAEGACWRCTLENTPATRQATKARIGPWYVLQTRNPAAPGMKFETLLAFVRKGRIKPRSVVRGPSTHQLWRFAAHVKGLSREFGVCYSCGEAIAQTAHLCPHCNRPQSPPANPDVFLEGQETDVPHGPIPIFRDVGAAPTAADDTVAPSIGGPAHQDALDPAARQTRPRKGSDGFLSAADLAAAFKLDFRPREEPRRKPKVAPLRAAHGSEPKPTPRRRRRWGRYVFLLFLVACIGAAGFQLHRDPALRAQAIDWYGTASTWTKQKWSELQKPAAKSQKPAPPTDGLQITPPADQPAQSTQPTQPASKPSPWDQIYHQNGANPNSSAAPQPRVGTLDDVRSLYRSAIDAEAQGDYATAVKKYEEIEEFSPDLRPRDLELRLKAARQQTR